MDEQNNKPELRHDEAGKLVSENNSSSPLKFISPTIHPIAAAIIGLVGALFLYQIVGGFLTIAIFGMKLENAPVNSVRLMTMAAQILFILLPALVFTKWFYEDVSTIIRFKIPDIAEIGLFSVGIIVLTPLLQYFITIQNYFIELWAKQFVFFHELKSFFDTLNSYVEKAYTGLLTAHSVFEGILIVIVVAVAPAICEEVMFRGFIQRSFEFKMKPFWAALITACFFGIYHFSPYGLIPLISLGFYFGYAAYKSDSIFVPMSLHFLNNFIAVMLFFTIGDDEIMDTTSVSSADLTSAIIMFFLLLSVFAGVIIFINKYYSKERKI